MALLESPDLARRAAGAELLSEVAANADAFFFDRVIANVSLGAVKYKAGELDAAEAHFRAAIAVTPAHQTATQEHHLRLAEVLLDRGRREDLDEVSRLLDAAVVDAPIFVSLRFKACILSIRYANAIEDAASAVHWAKAALALAELKHSGLANHPTLGLVQPDKQTLEWLRRLSEPSRGGLH